MDLCALRLSQHHGRQHLFLRPMRVATMTDATVADIARRLAVAFSRSGYERSNEAAKEVAALKTELCAAVRAEKDEANDQR